MKLELFVCALVLFVTQASSQRRELEADLIGIGQASHGVVSDNPSETTNLEMHLSIQNIVEFDPKTQVLEMTAWLMMDWKDGRFSWKPSEHGNITNVRIPSSSLPLPDIKLYNGARHGMVTEGEFNVAISSDGTIRYIPIVHIEAYCPNSDPTDDTLSCSLVFGSWTHPCHDLNITHEKDIEDLGEFHGGWRWQIVEHSSEVNEKRYSCCPETYCDTVINLKIRDKSRTPRGRWYYTYSHC